MGDVSKFRDYGTSTKSPEKTQTPFPDARWDWPIYLQNWVVLGVNVGKYTSPIEHLELCTGRKKAGNFPGNNLAGIRYWKNYVLS